MVPGAHRDTLPVEHLRDVVRMDAVDVQRDDARASLRGRAVGRDPRELAQTPERVLDEIVLVLLDRRRAPHRARSRPPRRSPTASAIAGVPASNLYGKLVPGRPLHRDRADHLPAEVERRHRLEQLLAPPERADPARAAHLVRRDREELAVERLHVDRPMRRGLGGIDDHDRPALVRPRRQVAHRVHGSERVRHEVGRDDLHRALALDRVQRVELQLAGLVDRDRLERGTGASGDVLPRDEARVVLEVGDDDDVARAEVVEAPRVRDEVQRLGRAPREDHLALGRGVHEARDLPASRLVPGRRALGEPVDASVDVGVRVLVEVTHRIEHLPRLLRRRGRVEEGNRPAVHELVEDREVGAQAMRVELRLRCYGHAAIVAARARLTRGRRGRSSRRARRHDARAAPSAPRSRAAPARAPCAGARTSRRGVRASRPAGARPSRPARYESCGWPRSGASTSLSVTSRSSPKRRSASSTAASSAGSSTSSIGVTSPVLNDRPSVSSVSRKRSPPSTRMLSRPSSKRVSTSTTRARVPRSRRPSSSA